MNTATATANATATAPPALARPGLYDVGRTDVPFTVGGFECVACDHPEAALQVRDLSVAYHGDTVLREVSATLHRGCITALIGPSGCGKTTFLGCLNRLIDLVPSSEVDGEVMLEGRDIRGRGFDVRELRRRVGMVFQRPSPFPMSIAANLDMPLREHGVRSRSEREGRMERALRDVGLWSEVGHKLQQSALALSGGQQQRLCIARALVLEPEVLLMDEPCSALDPISSAVVEDLIVRMRNRFTVVIVTHNLAQARRIANYVAFFWLRGSAGSLIEFGHSQQVFDAPRDPITADYVAGARG